MGLTRTETFSIPLSELRDLIAIYLIKHEGYERVKTQEEEDAELMAILNMR